MVCLLVAGCGDDSGSPGDSGVGGDGDGDGDACVGTDCGPDSGPADECDNDSDCESGSCDDGRCSLAECDDDNDCESGVCTDNACALSACDDDVENGDETGTDCGGPECDPCEGEPSCTDEMMNGTETGIDCGGSCAACEDSTCSDEIRNGDESDLDCGGPECDPCADHLDCVEGTDCISGVCHADACAEPTCDDGQKNGDETDTDCGGPGDCDRCEHGQACSVDDDCAPDTDKCDETCVVGPTAGFTLTTLAADTGQELTATSTATADGDIAMVEYDWGTGTFTTEPTHSFETGGNIVVTQRVTDEHGLSATTTLTVNVFQTVRLSVTDKLSHVFLSEDRLQAGITNIGSDGGVRSDASIAPGSGVYYFETTQLGLTGGGIFGSGVATATAALNDFMGRTNQSVGMNAAGALLYDDMLLAADGRSPVIGYVIDYRGANPIVQVIATIGGNVVRHRKVTMTGVTTPLFAAFSGQAQSHGFITKFNFGSDTQNIPFTYDPAAALNAANEADTAGALVLGFGNTRARPADAAPVLTPNVSMLSVAVGTEVTLTATATDVEDGSLTAQIQWEDMAVGFHQRGIEEGGTFTFTPDELGHYPIHVFVKDSMNVITEQTVMVTVTGALTQYDPVQLVRSSDTGAGIALSPDGLSTQYSGNGKMGIMANQGNYGQFWYYEMQRNFMPAENMGGGLFISHGSLNPISAATTQPSLQENFLGSTWRDLVFVANTPSATGYYGFAVDYRGTHPIVYVIVENVVVHTMTLDHVWTPIYPVLYGNPTEAVVMYDSTINFGVTAFHNNPTTALTNAGVSTTGFEAGWGDANTP